jgi:hypothetical protein
MNTFNSSNYNDLFQNVKLVVKETPKQQEEKVDTNTIVANKKVKLKKENIFMLPNSKMENEKVEEEKTEVKAPPELESPLEPPSDKRPVGKRGADKKDRKKRRDMTPARLEHLKKAREKALAKRRENAAKRRAEKAAKASATSAPPPVQQPPPVSTQQPTKKKQYTNAQVEASMFAMLDKWDDRRRAKKKKRQENEKVAATAAKAKTAPQRKAPTIYKANKTDWDSLFY